MPFSDFRQRIESVQELEALIGTPSELVIKKVLPELDEHMCRFLSESPFALIGTVDQSGSCDVSPRGDAPPVAKVLSPDSLILAERPGNRRADTLKNVMETGRIGLLFLVPGMGETLRINGRACVTKDQELLADLAHGDKVPLVGIGVAVEECYFQCAKALIRSNLWGQHTDHPNASADHYAKVLLDQTGVGDSVESLGEKIAESYRDRLY